MPATRKTVYTRAPSGVVTSKPIGLRLMAEERDQLEAISITENRSMAAQARIFFLHGLKEYQAQNAQPGQGQ